MNDRGTNRLARMALIGLATFALFAGGAGLASADEVISSDGGGGVPSHPGDPHDGYIPGFPPSGARDNGPDGGQGDPNGPQGGQGDPNGPQGGQG
jgi:hypothetical protein